jgi:dihydropteridine reductase
LLQYYRKYCSKEIYFTDFIKMLRVTIDTPANRQAMPSADYSSWTPTESIALQIHEWLEHPESLAHGGLYSVITQNNSTTFSQLK